jgi:hypothetical protein
MDISEGDRTIQYSDASVAHEVCVPKGARDDPELTEDQYVEGAAAATGSERQIMCVELRRIANALEGIARSLNPRG